MVERLIKMESNPSYTVRFKKECGELFENVVIKNNKIYKVLLHKSKSGNCQRAYADALYNIMNYCIKLGGDPVIIAEKLRGIRCDKPFRYENNVVLSCPDAIGQSLLSIQNQLNQKQEEVNENEKQK